MTDGSYLVWDFCEIYVFFFMQSLNPLFVARETVQKLKKSSWFQKNCEDLTFVRVRILKICSVVEFQFFDFFWFLNAFHIENEFNKKTPKRATTYFHSRGDDVRQTIFLSTES